MIEYSRDEWASPKQQTEAIERVARHTARYACECIEAKAPNHVLAATALMVAADMLLTRAIHVDPRLIETARKIFRITLKLEDPA